jgi:hypothetical protein
VLTPPPALVALATSSLMLTVDPGLDNPAAAAWDRGTLIAASRVKVPDALAELDDIERLERTRRIAELICAWGVAALGGRVPTLVVCEFPQVYTREKSKGDPNVSLMPLASLDGAIAGRLCAYAIAPKPAEWIGQIPKATTGGVKAAWTSVRGAILKSRSRPGELERIVPSHDAVDAYGIGLWILGRLGKSFPGAW